MKNIQNEGLSSSENQMIFHSDEGIEIGVHQDQAIFSQIFNSSSLPQIPPKNNYGYIYHSPIEVTFDSGEYEEYEIKSIDRLIEILTAISLGEDTMVFAGVNKNYYDFRIEVEKNNTNANKINSINKDLISLFMNNKIFYDTKNITEKPNAFILTGDITLNDKD